MSAPQVLVLVALVAVVGPWWVPYVWKRALELDYPLVGRVVLTVLSTIGYGLIVALFVSPRAAAARTAERARVDEILEESRRERERRARQRPEPRRERPQHAGGPREPAPAPPRPPSPEESARRVLGVKPSATLDDIKGAYRRLAQIHHPDRNPGDPQAKVRMQAINDAWDTLRRSSSVSSS